MASFCSATVTRPVARAGANVAARPAPALPPPSPLARPGMDSDAQPCSVRSSIVAHAASQVASPEAAQLSEEELIQLTKDFVAADFGGADQGAMLSDEFIFRGPVIGPLPRDTYIKALSSFKVPDAFPDIKTNAFGYSIDPTDPYRVWFFTQTTGTHTGNFTFGGTTIAPTGGKIQNGTEANSIIWTPDRKVKYISVGYCVDRINSNTPNGTMKVAVAGFLRAAGNPGIWDIAINPVVLRITNFVNKLQGKPSTDVPYDSLPAWWKELPDGSLRGAENYDK